MSKTIFLEDKKSFNRALSEAEKKLFTNINKETGKASFPQANTTRIKYLAKGGESTRDEQSSLCVDYDCLAQGSTIHVYNKTSGGFIAQITHFDKLSIQNLCTLSDIECVADVEYYATYNCIGWAIGVTKWVQPSDITYYVNNGSNITEAINLFLQDKSKFYRNSTANKFNIADNLTSIENRAFSMPFNNTVAFYFNDKNEFLHGARYVDTILNTPIDSWTSKLGMSFLVSHGSEDLKGANSIYGNNIAYAIIAGQQVDNTQIDDL